MTRAGRDDGTGESSLEALAQQWLRAVAAHGFVPRKARARVALRELLRQLVAAARAEPFDPAPGRRIGAALVEARMAAPQVLGVSVPLLTERLPALLDADDATVRSRVLPLLGELAFGFTSALRDTAMLAAEELSRSERVAWRAEQRLLISVNLSPLQLADPDLLATIDETLDRTGLPAAARATCSPGRPPAGRSPGSWPRTREAHTARAPAEALRTR